MIFLFIRTPCILYSSINIIIIKKKNMFCETSVIFNMYQNNINIKIKFQNIFFNIKYVIIRQIRDTIAWVFSEPMLHYYIQLFTKSWWPNGHLVSETISRSDEEKLKTRGEARRQFLNNIPDVLTNLVGSQSAQRGAIKIFDSLQNVNLNKQLFYVSYHY